MPAHLPQPPHSDNPALGGGPTTEPHPANIPLRWSLEEAVPAQRRSFTLGIVGAGLMGTTIAAEAVRRHFRVAITDARPEVLLTVTDRIAAELAGSQPPSEAIIQAVRRRVESTTTQSRLARCAVLLESVTEQRDVKRSVLAGLEPLLAPGAILASNTSTIPIDELASPLADPSRFCGLHFFHPVRCRPLVEIVRGSRTSPATLAAAEAFVRRLGKVPVIVADGPGFCVNRLLFPYLSEALELLRDGVRPERVEAVALRFGMAMGPLRLLDEIGLDTAVLAGRVLYQAFPDRIVASPLLVALYKAKRWGRKSGAGFFQYPPQDGAAPVVDPEVDRLIAAWGEHSAPLSDDQVLHRLLLPVALEATRLLAEGKVGSAEDLDRAAVLGLGFPASLGGPLAWAARLGPRQILRFLEPWQHLGPRMHPTPWLVEAARGLRPLGPRLPTPPQDTLSCPAGTRPGNNAAVV